MNKTEYMNELKKRLSGLPYEEFQNAIMYYEEYFDDAGVENEQEVINNLGTPAEVAGQLIGEFATKEQPTKTPPPSTKKTMKVIWITILAIFASPIALPIAIALAAVAFAIIVSVFAVFISIAVTGVAMVVSGVGVSAVTLVGMIMGAAHIGDGLFLIGSGLLSAGLGVLITMLTVFLSRVTFKGISKLIGRVLVKKNKRKEDNSNENFNQNINFNSKNNATNGNNYNNN